MAPSRSQQGVTLLEVLVATSISVALTVAAFPNLSRGLSGHRLAAAARATAGVIRVARSVAIAGNQQARVSFSAGNKTLTVETAPTGSSTWTATEAAVTLDGGISIPEPPTFTFANTGTTSSVVTVTLTNGSGATKTVRVGVLGAVDIS